MLFKAIIIQHSLLVLNTIYWKAYGDLEYNLPKPVSIAVQPIYSQGRGKVDGHVKGYIPCENLYTRRTSCLHTHTVALVFFSCAFSLLTMLRHDPALKCTRLGAFISNVNLATLHSVLWLTMLHWLVSLFL